ncbi:MAG: heme NO-binding domain-containing protein [Steroidobacteraceae bacterium]
MKGLVFTELVEFVEQSCGMEVADRMISESNLPSGGVYTAVGTYDHKEIIELLTTLVKITGQPPNVLLKAFGGHLHGRFVAAYPDFFTQAGNLFNFLESIEGHIHVEVRKLYPDAELPTFNYERPATDKLVMIYRSTRGMADLAEGLIEAAVMHFKEPVQLSREDKVPDALSTRFTLQQLRA